MSSIKTLNVDSEKTSHRPDIWYLEFYVTFKVFYNLGKKRFTVTLRQICWFPKTSRVLLLISKTNTKANTAFF